MRTAGVRIATWLVALVVGAIYGTAGTISHAYAPALPSTSVPIPVGLVLSIIGLAALLVGIRLLLDRWSTLAAGLGAIAATVLFSTTGPGGSVLVPNDPLSLAWSIAAPLVAAVVVVWPERRRTATPAGGSPEGAR